MKVAIGASFHRRQEMMLFAYRLKAIGAEVTSVWFGESDDEPDQKLVENALTDLRTIRECDVFVRFTNSLDGLPFVPNTWATGGKDFEMGYAYALGKPIYVVGGRQNIFDRLPNLIHVKDEAALLRLLSPVEVM